MDIFIIIIFIVIEVQIALLCWWLIKDSNEFLKFKADYYSDNTKILRRLDKIGSQSYLTKGK